MQANGFRTREFLSEEAFVRRLDLERKRTERSRRPFVLMLLESTSLLRAEGAGGKDGARQKILRALSNATRETDIRGWYRDGATVGIAFTEITAFDPNSITEFLAHKIGDMLSVVLSAQQVSQINLSFHFFPEDWDRGGGADSADSTLYTRLARTSHARKASLLVKRSVDIVGSVVALIAGLPLFAVIAVSIRLNSKGPVLFRQERVGQYHKRFTFFKFRSMYSTSNQAIHQDYAKRFISGEITSSLNTADKQTIYKLTDDPRITSIGRLLRKTSLDELPQFLNVLRGEMSLVGPRPPLPYEVDCYDLWHRRRLLEVKPGITGLWQVTGRSRTRFDDMVRLDLQYAMSWSLWLDLKILCRTPGTVLMGDGAH